MRIPLLLMMLIAVGFVSCDKSGEGNKKEEHKRVLPGKVETYEYARGVSWSRQYDVTISGETQRVIPTGEPEICIFGCTDTVEVKISAVAEAISTVTVRPQHKEPEYSVDGNTVTLYMAPYDRYDIEINGNEATPLFLFANPVDENKPDKNDPNVVFYAAGDTYDVGNLNLKSGQTLYIEGGAIVNGSVRADNASDITIAGGGILDGRTQSGNKVRLTECSNVTLKNITVLGKNNWTTYLIQCQHIDSDGYKVVATFSDKTDGSGNENDSFDLMGCSHATVRRGFCYCHDDTYCIKTQKWLVGGVSTDITFEDCVSWNKDCGNGFVVGYETNMDVSDVTFKNCSSIHSAGASNPLRRGALSVHNGAGGTISGVRFENIHVEDPKEFGIYIEIIKSNYDIGNGIVWTPGHVRDVTFKNIYFDKRPSAKNVISGYDESHRIENMTVEGLYIAGREVTSISDGNFATYRNADVTFK